MSDSVERLADRAAADPHFLAFALAEYAIAEGLDRAGLIVTLGVPSHLFPDLQLCRAPRVDPEGFREDIDRIAGRFGLNKEDLVVVARHGQVVAAHRAAAEADPKSAGFLLAARDRPQT